MSFYLVEDYPSLPGLTFPIIRTPEWDTDVQIALSGRRTAFPRRIYPRYRFELIYTFLRNSTTIQEFQELLAFYNKQGGRAGLFVYNVADDNNTNGAQNIGTGDGTTTQFQAVRALTGSADTFIEPVYAIKTVTQVTVGSSNVSTATYSVGVSGVFTFSTTNIPPAGQAITWNGTYGWYCRFDEDTIPFEKFVSGIYEVKKVKFSSETF